jgi:hypothetical protein
VLVHDKDEPRRKWKLGYIEKLHRGSDGLTRSAAGRTATGSSNRAMAKLYPLDLNVGMIEGKLASPSELNTKKCARRAAAVQARERIIGLQWNTRIGLMDQYRSIRQDTKT